MTQQTNALRLAERLDADWMTFRTGNHSCKDAAAELRRLDAENNTLHEIIDRRTAKLTAAEAERDQLKADYQRLMDKHNNLHINAKQCRTEHDQLRAQLAESESERQEQARLLGMSAERELALRAQVDQLCLQLSAAHDSINSQSVTLELRAARCLELANEVDELRAQVERLQGGESVAVIGPPNKQCHTCGFVGPEDVVMGCPKCGFDDMRAIRSTAGFLPDWEFDVHDDDDGLTWLNIYPPHGAVAAFSVQTKRRDGQTTIAAEVLRKFVKAIKAAQLQANSPFCPGCGSTECDQPAAPALVPWRDIETAPKDGSDCWLLVDGKVHRGFWVEIEFEERRDMDGRYIDQTDADAYWMDHDSGDSLEPTMFYPIEKPMPPAPVGIGQPVGREG